MALTTGARASLMVQLVDVAGQNASTAAAGQFDPLLAVSCSSFMVPGPNLPAAAAAGQAARYVNLTVDQGSWCGGAPQVSRAKAWLVVLPACLSAEPVVLQCVANIGCASNHPSNIFLAGGFAGWWALQDRNHPTNAEVRLAGMQPGCVPLL